MWIRYKRNRQSKAYPTKLLHAVTAYNGGNLNDGFLEIDLFKIRCSLLQNINLQLLSTAYDRDHNIDEQHF